MKAELKKKKEERQYITQKLTSVECDIAELRKCLYKIQELQKNNLLHKNRQKKRTMQKNSGTER